jgi:MoaA/NifB/PqqE/SkfB family radical SAM enzyme
LDRQGNDRRGYFRVATRLLYNAWRFRRARRLGTPLKPAVLSLAVTNRCNSHCIMCNIWKSAGEIPDLKSLELSRDDIISLLSTPLFSELIELDLTGGEPHLRDDLVDIVLGIIQLKQSFLPRLRSVIITSNGYLTQRIISDYEKILDGLEGTDIDLVSVTSLDGIGETHDLIRGTKGAFKLASETITGLSELRGKYPNFIAGIKTTILSRNVGSLDDILDYALSGNLFHIISPVLFAGARFMNIELRDGLALRPSELKKVLDFYRRSELDTSYFYAAARRFLTTGRKPWACTALYNYAFINYEGNVYPCEIIPEPIGNVKEQAFQDIWHSPGAHDWRKKIGRLDCCRTCHEPGAVRYSAFTEGWSYLRFLLNKGRRGYRASWLGEGISKYKEA